jgi:superoxide reductase
MHRRLFIKNIGLVSVGAAFIAPQKVFAAGPNPMTSAFAGSIYYTKTSPGRWAGKEDGHVPTIERNGNSVQVTTGHEMNGYEHYIIKHQVFNNNLEFVHEVMFDPETEAPVSEHDISGLKDTIYVVSLCNKHDAWLNVLKL